ncbi:MAG: aminotransferase class I/II-fold pyridoxal phosphate-dependent enzyme [Lacipirellulaceae bacterium]
MILTSGGVNTASFASVPGACLEILHRDALQNPAEVVNVLVRCLSDRWSTPFWDRLKRHAIIGNDTWFCPGHNKGNAYARSPFIGDFGELFAPAGGLALSSDVSVSIQDLGDLSEPLQSTPMNAVMKKSADTFGAAFTLYSTNGTSTSNNVMLMALLRPGDVILVDRNCHKSVHQAIVIAGALPVYLHSAYNADLGIWLPVSIKEIGSSIQRMEKAKMLPRMLILTSCTYEGAMYPVSKIADLCNRHGVLFYADEAWLPYGRFHPAYMTNDGSSARFNALGTGDGDGAHIVVQSTHKMLSALSQASMIHIGQAFVECFASGNV